MCQSLRSSIVTNCPFLIATLMLCQQHLEMKVPITENGIAKYLYPQSVKLQVEAKMTTVNDRDSLSEHLLRLLEQPDMTDEDREDIRAILETLKADGPEEIQETWTAEDERIYAQRSQRRLAHQPSCQVSVNTVSHLEGDASIEGSMDRLTEGFGSASLQKNSVAKEGRLGRDNVPWKAPSIVVRKSSKLVRRPEDDKSSQ
jgi:hypothetical protein